ncbi:ctr1-like protein kinase, partial [Chrysochromulina tobinii]
DLATCVVVKVLLPSNNLIGSLDGALCELPSLQHLDLSGNALTGSLPSAADCWPRLTYLDLTQTRSWDDEGGVSGRVPEWLLDRLNFMAPLHLANNAFDDPTAAESAVAISRIWQRCQTLGAERCSGVPPIGCSAFNRQGQRYEVELDGLGCVRCPTPLEMGLVGCGIAFIVLLLMRLLGLYTRFMRDYPEHAKTHFATFMILVGHLQTLTIIGSMQLGWPLIIQEILASINLPFMSYIPVPCILTDPVLKALLSYAETAVALLPLVGAWLVASEYDLSVLFSFLFTFGLRASVTLFMRYDEDQTRLIIARLVAPLLWLFWLFLLWRFHRLLREARMTEENAAAAKAKAAAAEAAPAPTGRIGMGEYVMVNGRRGKITSDNGTSNPYKVTFDNGEARRAAEAVRSLTERYASDDGLSHGDFLLLAEKEIDGPIRERLEDGTIRLLFCEWLLSEDSDKYLGRDASGKVIMRRRQELPKEAFLTNEEAVKLFDQADRSILALSYRWLTAIHPDPHGTALFAVRRFLGSEAGLGKCGMFWDFASLPQKDIDNGQRTVEEAVTMKRGLVGMGYFYASMRGTAIVQLKDIPPRPSEYDGRMIVFDEKYSEKTSEKDVVADLERFGGKITKIAFKAGEAHVTFATHEQAKDCIAELDEDKRGACTVYNETAYSRDRGEPFSGWCTFEQGSSKLAAAHLNMASRQASKRSTVLPERLKQANASRAKVIDISDSQARRQPYAKRQQHLLEVFLYAVDIMAIILAVVYGALTNDGTVQDGFGRLALELVLGALLILSVVGAARLFIFDYKFERSYSRQWYLHHGLVKALEGTKEARQIIDEPIEAALRDGADMPPDAFLPPQRAAALYAKQRRGVKVVSYGWRSPGVPDPDGCALAKIRAALKSKQPPEKASAVQLKSLQEEQEEQGLFVDIACMPQTFSSPSWYAPGAVPLRFGAKVSQGPLTVLKFEWECAATERIATEDEAQVCVDKVVILCEENKRMCAGEEQKKTKLFRMFAKAKAKAKELFQMCGNAKAKAKTKSDLKEPTLMGEHVFENELKFKRGLSVMGSLYASATGTCVLQLTDPPGELGSDIDAPSELVSERTGTVFVMRTNTSLEELRKELGDRVLACEKRGGVRQWQLKERKKGGGEELSDELKQAEASSLKLINIDLIDAPREVVVAQSPEQLLCQCKKKLRSKQIFFTGKADQKQVVQLLSDFEDSIAVQFDQKRAEHLNLRTEVLEHALAANLREVTKDQLFASSDKLTREYPTSVRDPTNNRRSHKDLINERVSIEDPGRTRARTLGTMPGNEPSAPIQEGTEMSSIVGWGEGSSQRAKERSTEMSSVAGGTMHVVKRLSWKELTLKESLGAGSFGEVRVAVWNSTPCAIKSLRAATTPAALQELLNEFDRAILLHHPNVILTMGIAHDDDGGKTGILMELMPASLLDVLHHHRQREQLATWEASLVLIALDVAKGMAFLHAMDVVHRDLKPGNVLLMEHWVAKVADFGTALTKYAGQAEGAAGTPPYMAPEAIALTSGAKAKPTDALLEHGAALDPTANGTHSAMMVAVENGNLPPAADLLLRARLPCLRLSRAAELTPRQRMPKVTPP